MPNWFPIVWTITLGQALPLNCSGCSGYVIETGTSFPTYEFCITAIHRDGWDKEPGVNAMCTERISN